MTDSSVPQTGDVGDSQPDTAAEMTVAMYQRESPVPSAAELKAYFDISPEVGNQIMGMARDAASHRHQIQGRTMTLTLVVVLCITIVLLAVVAAAVWIAIEVTPVGGVALGISPVGLIGLSGFFSRKRRSRTDDR